MQLIYTIVNASSGIYIPATWLSKSFMSKTRNKSLLNDKKYYVIYFLYEQLYEVLYFYNTLLQFFSDAISFYA